MTVWILAAPDSSADVQVGCWIASSSDLSNLRSDHWFTNPRASTVPSPHEVAGAIVLEHSAFIAFSLHLCIGSPQHKIHKTGHLQRFINNWLFLHF